MMTGLHPPTHPIPALSEICDVTVGPSEQIKINDCAFTETAECLCKCCEVCECVCARERRLWRIRLNLGLETS